HELATNAAKYGALSTPHGRVEVNWNRRPNEDAANLSIAWREVGGPAVAASPDCRYGVGILRQPIPQELRAFGRPCICIQRCLLQHRDSPRARARPTYRPERR